MIKRLGGKRWRALHRLAYVAAIAGVIHYYMQVKAACGNARVRGGADNSAWLAADGILAATQARAGGNPQTEIGDVNGSRRARPDFLFKAHGDSTGLIQGKGAR